MQPACAHRADEGEIGRRSGRRACTRQSRALAAPFLWQHSFMWVGKGEQWGLGEGRKKNSGRAQEPAPAAPRRRRCTEGGAQHAPAPAGAARACEKTPASDAAAG